MRVTVFHGTKEDFVQAVITSDKIEYFKELGFVSSADELPKEGGEVELESQVMYYRDKINKLGGSYGPRSGLDALKATYNKLMKAKKHADSKEG